MKIQEYVDLIREIKNKNGLEWNSNVATLAVYQYLKSPAISDYYNTIDLYRNSNGTPMICDVAGVGYTNISAKVGHFSYDGSRIESEADQITFHIASDKNISFEKLGFSTNKLKTQMLDLREKLLKSESFSEFAKGYSESNKDLLLDSSLDFKIKKLLQLAAFVDSNKAGASADDTFRRANDCDFKEVTMVLSLLDDSYKFANHRHQTIIRPVLNIIEKQENLSANTIFDNMATLAHYDNIETDSYYFDIRNADEKIAYFEKLSKMPEIKDNTVFGVIMNNPDDIVNKIADTFIFDELKSLALIQTRLALKEATLDELLESNPVINEIYQEAVKRSPMLEVPMSERFKHLHIIDEEFDVGEKGRKSFSELMDGVGLYGDIYKHHYLTIQPEIIVFPQGSSNIMNDQPFERFYGHDGVGPYYVAFAMQSDFTKSTNALLFEKIFISKNLDDGYVREMFENILQNCMTRKMAFIITDANFKNVVGEKNFAIFNEVKAVYKDVVPIITDTSKYKAMSDFDLTYTDILKVEERFKSLMPSAGRNNIMLSQYHDCIENFKNEQVIEKKSTPKI